MVARLGLRAGGRPGLGGEQTGVCGDKLRPDLQGRPSRWALILKSRCEKMQSDLANSWWVKGTGDRGVNITHTYIYIYGNLEGEGSMGGYAAKHQCLPRVSWQAGGSRTWALSGRKGWGKDLVFVSKRQGKGSKGKEDSGRRGGHPDGPPVLVLRDLGSWQ